MPLQIVPLHIAIDVRRLADFGIGTYIRNLVGGLSRIDLENRYTLVARSRQTEQFASLSPRFQAVAYDHPDTDLVQNATFPLYLRKFRADLFHIPLNSVAYWMPKP